MKTLIFLSFLIIPVLTGCNRTPGTEDTKKTSSEVTINPDNVVMVDMDVRGMTCTDCENTIKSGISELNGVVNVTADYKAGKTTVQCDTAITPVARITEVIEKRGYSVAGAEIKPVAEEPRP